MITFELVSVLSFLLHFVIIPSSGEKPTYTLCNAKLNTPRTSVGAIYDGDDSIYLFGGIYPENYCRNEIYLYTISSDSLATVGTLYSRGCFPKHDSVSINSNGIIHAFASEDSSYVTRFDTKTNTSTFAMHLRNGQNPFLQLGEDEAIFIFDAWSDPFCELLQINLTSMEKQMLGSVCSERYHFFSDAALNEKDGLAYFIADNEGNDTDGKMLVLQYSVEDKNMTEILEVENRFNFGSSAVWVNNNDMMYVIDVEGDETDECVAVFDPSENSLTYLAVDGMNKSLGWVNRAAVYVEKLQRIYLFGGKSEKGEAAIKEEIWKIDLNIPVTTEPPTDFPISTETSLPDFCSDRADGFYPNPDDCSAFVGCRDEESFEFLCPGDHLFDPILLSCRHPHDVVCGFHCVGRENGVYPHPKDCAAFLSCHYEFGQILFCPEPLLFDPIQSRCNFPHLVDCDSTTE